MNRVWVVGGSGQIGRALVRLFGDQAIATSVQQLDLSFPGRIRGSLDRLEADGGTPTAVINAAAYTRVDRAEAEESLASPWREDDAAGPVNAYGRTKLKGDRLVEASGARHLILRTSWVYDAHGRNFINTMLSLGGEREALRVVADQVGAPSYAPHLAQLTRVVLDRASQMDAFPSRTFHLAPEGEVSWHGFARWQEGLGECMDEVGLRPERTRPL